MNSQGLNSGAVGGGGSASRAIAAAAIGLATLVCTTLGTRVVGASAYGDAVANVTLTGSQLIAAKATGLGSSTWDVQPEIRRAAYAVAAAGSTGNGSVLRAVSGTAGGDGYSTGEALAADALGESVDSGLSFGGADAHTIHPGRVLMLCEANSQADAIPIRMSPAIGDAGVSGFGEATMQLDGEAFSRHDGYSLGTSTATAEVRNDYMATTATLGAFDFGRAEGSCTTFVRYQATSSVWSTAQSQANPIRTTRATATASATATGDVAYMTTFPASAFAQSGSTAYMGRSKVAYQAKSLAQANVTGVIAAKATRFGRATASAQVSLVSADWAQQRQGAATSLAQASGSALGVAAPFGGSASIATATGSAKPANNPKGFVLTSAESLGAALPASNPKGQSAAAADSFGHATTATHHRVNASAQSAGAGSAVAGRKAMSTAFASGGVSMYAPAITNADALAPDDRAMKVPEQSRLMDVPYQNRLMEV